MAVSEAISVRDSATGREQIEPADGLFVLIGADPHSDWLADTVERDSKGFLLTGPDLSHWQLDRPPLSQETSAHGVFAARRRAPWFRQTRGLSRR